MRFVLQPWQIFLLILAGWVNRHQQDVLDYLITENRILREKLGNKRILLNDDQRRRLAIKGKILGRKVLSDICTLATPETILRWHRMLVANKWNYSERRKKLGRPSIEQEIIEPLLQMPRDNPSWGYDRFQGALPNLGYEISDTTAGNILRRHGIEPAPERTGQTSWRTFIQAHWDVLAAIDFTTIEIWSKNGLTAFYLLFVMELYTRRVHFAGCTANPDDGWIIQVGRNLTDTEEGFIGKDGYPKAT